MKIKWLGHASVLISSADGLRIIADPYRTGYHAPPGGTLTYKEIDEVADIILVSHEHPDHSNIDVVRGKPEVVRCSTMKQNGSVTVKGIEFKCLPCYHDNVEGKLLGENNMALFEVDGMRICHTGDIGHSLSDKQVAQLGRIDVLLLSVGLLAPVGEPRFASTASGKSQLPWQEYIIDADVANQIYYQLHPQLTIPIHYGNEKCSFHLVNVEEFLKGKPDVVRMESSEIEVTPDTIKTPGQIISLQPAN
jgi:L-ascorbate metabolism protein UlaG (beta-lactamase superfamily)